MSATTVARINTIVTANTTQFTAAMGKAQTRAGKFAAAAGVAAKAASGPLTMALIGVAGAAVKAATDFDDSMTKIESLVGIASDEVDAMAESVKALSGETARHQRSSPTRCSSSSPRVFVARLLWRPSKRQRKHRRSVSVT